MNVINIVNTKWPVSYWVRGTSTPSFTSFRRRPTLTTAGLLPPQILVLEILLPLLLFSLLASSLLGPLFRLIWRTLRRGSGIAIRVVDFIAARVLDPILEMILP